MLEYLWWHRDKRERGLSFHSCISPVSNPITPHNTKGDSPFCLFFLSKLCFAPSSLVSHHLLLTLLLSKKDAWRTFHHIDHWENGEGLGVVFHPFSLMWLYSGSVYPSVTSFLSSKPNSSSSPHHLGIVPSIFPLYPLILSRRPLSLLLLPLLYVLHRSSLMPHPGSMVCRTTLALASGGLCCTRTGRICLFLGLTIQVYVCSH